MAFTVENNGANATAMASALKAAGAIPPQQQAAPSGVQRQSLRALLGQSTAIMASNSGSAALNTFKKSVDELFKDLDTNAVKVVTIAFDNAVPGAAYYSGLLFVLQLTSEPKIASYHYVMLAGSRDLPEARTNSENNVRYDVVTTPGQLYDVKMVERIIEQLKSSFPTIHGFLNTGCTTLPQRFDYANADSVRRVASSVVNACGSELMMRTGKSRAITFDPNQVLLDMVPEVSINFGKLDNNGQSVITDATGSPVRSDVNMILNMRSPQSNHNVSKNEMANSLVLAKVHGYVDVIYSKPQQQNNAFGFMGQPQMPQCFQPSYIITDVGTETEFNDNTMALAIDSSMTIMAGRAWMNAFTPTLQQLSGKKNRVDTRNVGALNVIANMPMSNNAEPTQWGPVLSLTDAGFSNERLAAYMNGIFDANGFFNIAIDCPVNGAQSWIFNTINDAATGSAAALNRWFDAVNTLTAGEFSKAFDRKADSVFSMSEVILAGTYEDENGHQRDLRDVDLVWACAMLHKEPNEIFSFMKTFGMYDKGAHSADLRLHGRRRMLMALTNDTARITGQIYRHYFSSKFLLALRHSLAKLGYTPSIVSTMTTDSFNSVRVSADFVSGGLSMNMGHGMFGTNGINQGFNSINGTSFRNY